VFPGNVTPPRMRVAGKRSSDLALKLLAGLQQLRAEVWVATSEGTVAYIDIIDVLAKVHIGSITVIHLTLCHVV